MNKGSKEETESSGKRGKMKKNIINEQNERQRNHLQLQYLTRRAGVSNAVRMHKPIYCVYIYIIYLTLFYHA